MRLPATRLVASSHARCAAPRCVRDDVTVRLESGLPSGLRVGTLEPDDLPHCITVLLECFYKDTLTLAESEFSEEEMKKLRPTLEKINGAFTLYNRLALTQTTRLRLGRRLLSGGTWQMQPPCSLVLVAQEAESCKIVAVAELSTQPLDGKVPGDIRMPTLPWRVSRATVRASRSLTRANLSATLAPSPRGALSVARRSVPTSPTCASRAAGGGAPSPAPPCRRLSLSATLACVPLLLTRTVRRAGAAWPRRCCASARTTRTSGATPSSTCTPPPTTRACSPCTSTGSTSSCPASTSPNISSRSRAARRRASTASRPRAPGCRSYSYVLLDT